MGVRFPYTVHVTMKGLRDVFAVKNWCIEQYGKQFDVVDNRTGTWSYCWAGVERMRQYEYQFAREQDAVMFSLRWLQ